MSITTEIIASAATSAGTGFHFELGNPTAFQIKDDVSSSSDIRAYMGSAAGAAGDSTSKNTLSFLASRSNTPTATRTTRKIKVRAWAIANMHSSAPGGSSVKAGLRYSINSGGAYTTIVEITNSTANTQVDNGGFQEYEITLGISQDITLVRIEAYTEADSGPGGGTADASYGRIFAAYGIMEDYEDGINLLTVRPSSIVFDAATPPDTSNDFDEGLCRDGIVSTFSHFETNWFLNASTRSRHQTANFPAVSIGSGLVHAQCVFIWAGSATINSIPSVTTSVRCETQANASEAFVIDADPNSIVIRGSGSGSGTSTQAETTFLKDITSLFKQVEEVKMRMRATTDGIGLGSNTGIAEVREFYLEVRVPEGSAGPMAGWEPL